MHSNVIDFMNLISELSQFESHKGDLPKVEIGQVIDLSSIKGLTKGSNTGRDFYKYLSCFYKVVRENGLEINDNYPIELISKFKIEEIYDGKVIRENLRIFRKEGA